MLAFTVQQYSSEYIGTPDDDGPPFQLATPPGFQVNHIHKRNLVWYTRYGVIYWYQGVIW